MEVFTQYRVSELRDEIVSLQKQNSVYARQPFHGPTAKIAHDLRRVRLEAIKDDLMRLNKPITRGMP